jgi:hypothetical protein
MVTLISERDDNPKIMIIAKTGRATTTYRLIPVLLSKIPFSSKVNQHILFKLVTPIEQIYSNVEDVLFSEGLKMFSLLAGTMAAIAVLIVFLIRWSKILNKEVRMRTRELFESERRKRELEESYETTKRYSDEALKEVSVWKKRRS